MIKRIALVLIFALLVMGAEPPWFPQDPHAGTEADPWPIYNSPTVAISFNAYTMQIVKAVAEVAKDKEFTEVVATVELTGKENFPRDAKFKFPIFEKVEALPNGLYWCRGRVWDQWGNRSAWSTPTAAKKTWDAPPPPGGCAIIFR